MQGAECENIRLIVETITDIVCWQVLANAITNSKQVAHGVAIFLAIQTAQGNTSGFWRAGTNHAKCLFVNPLVDGVGGTFGRAGFTGGGHVARTENLGYALPLGW